jgi:hypothetical protein
MLNQIFLKEEILKAKLDNSVIIKRSAVNDRIHWKDFFNIFNTAKDKDLRFQSFATLTINHSEDYSKVFDNICKDLESIHPGQKIAVMSILHFVSIHNNSLTDQDFLDFKNKFDNMNPNDMLDLNDPNNFIPSRHSDDVDGFYIQCDGSTIWRVFKDEVITEYLVNTGDILYIPKFIEHSVETLCPRNAISVAFRD